MKKIFRSFILLFQRTYTAKKCGHKTKLKGQVVSMGETTVIEMPLQDDGKPEYCHGCLAQFTKPCAFCGKPIFIGERICLVRFDEEHKDKIVDGSYVTEDGNNMVCLRIGCGVPSLMCGIWHPPGEIMSIVSPAQQALNSGGPVIVPDVTQYVG